MSKHRKYSFNVLYLLGSILILLGLFLPVLNIGPIHITGLKMLSNDRFSYVVAGILIFVGAGVGFIACFFPPLMHYKFSGFLMSIFGGVLLFIMYGSTLVKAFTKVAGPGFYVIIIGWVVAFIALFA